MILAAIALLNLTDEGDITLHNDLSKSNTNGCECGAHKVYGKEANLEYLHAFWCPLYLDPNWMTKLKNDMRGRYDN